MIDRVQICGRTTVAPAHFLLTSNMVKGDVTRFLTRAGVLIIRKSPNSKSKLSNYQNTPPPVTATNGDVFCDEMSFPASSPVEESTREEHCLPQTLNGVEFVNVQKTSFVGDLIVRMVRVGSLLNLVLKAIDVIRI